MLLLTENIASSLLLNSGANLDLTSDVHLKDFHYYLVILILYIVFYSGILSMKVFITIILIFAIITIFTLSLHYQESHYEQRERMY